MCLFDKFIVNSRKVMEQVAEMVSEEFHEEMQAMRSKAEAKKNTPKQANVSPKQPQITNAQLFMTQRMLYNELLNLSDYASRAISAIPGYYNVDTQVNQNSLYPQKLEENVYSIQLQKKDCSKEIHRVELDHIEKAMNSALRAVRFDAETDVEDMQQRYRSRKYDLMMEQCWNPAAKNYAYEMQKVDQDYMNFLNKHRHLLCGLEVTSFIKHPNYIEVILRCDPTIRILL